MMTPKLVSPRHHTPGKSRFAPPSPAPRTPRQGQVAPPSPCPRTPRQGQGSKVRVVVRVRPFLASEVEASQGASLAVVTHGEHADGSLLIADPKTSRKETYKLDMCYGAQVESCEIFRRELEPMLPSLFRGYNSTVFTYGATGSGKTFTILGTPARPGLMTLAMTSIFLAADKVECTVRIAYYEVYMDRCYDLLQPKTEVSVLEDPSGRIQLRGLAQVEVRTLDEFKATFAEGCARRKVGQTGLNDASSRSHGVLMVTVTCGKNELQTEGKLNLIDLAGNEDNRRSGNEGVRLLESTKINASLFALSNVINALNANELRVPYRDSKLTRILQDSLGGTSQAIMIACLNPGSYQEASQTLSLAARSRQINNTEPADGENDTSETSGKLNMEAKLLAWWDAKGKTTVAKSPHVPSPLRGKTSCPSPERSHMVRSVPTTKKRPLMNSTAPQDAEADKECQPATYTPQPVVDNVSATPMKDLDVFQDAPGEEPVQETAELPAKLVLNGQESNKENLSQELDVWATHTREPKLPTSPPLSARLRDIRNSLMSPRPSPSIMTKLEPPMVLSSCLEYPSDPTNSPTIKENPLFFSTPMEDWDISSRGVESSLLEKFLQVLNTARKDELMALKGIGEKRATRVIDLREEFQEPFQKLEDLEKIGVSMKQARKLFVSNVAKKLESCTPR